MCVYVFTICNHSSLTRCMSSEFLWQTFLDGSTEQQPLHFFSAPPLPPPPPPPPPVFGVLCYTWHSQESGFVQKHYTCCSISGLCSEPTFPCGSGKIPTKNTLKGEGVMKYTVYNGKNCTHNYNGWSRPFFRLHVVVMLLSAYHAYEQRRPIFYRV